MRDSLYRSAKPASRVRVMIADDHETVRQGLDALFALVPEVEIIDQVGDTDAVLTGVRRLAPDVVVMDLSMPSIGGLAAIRLIKAEAPDLAIIVWTRYSDPSFVREAVIAGAAGYVLKQSAFAELRQAIEAVVRGERYFDSRLTAQLEPPPDVDGPLSSRERDILRRSALGQSNKEIAAALAISVRTVEVHKTHGMRKLALQDRRELIRYASMRGWIADS